MIARATGESAAVRGLIAMAATSKEIPVTTRSSHAVGFSMSRWRDAVRGFRLSSDQSAMRLKSIAAVLAKIIQSRTNEKVRNEGRTFAATNSAPKANGSAKMVCEKRIKRRNRVNVVPSTIVGISTIRTQ